MSAIVNIEDLSKLLIKLRDEDVLLDADVAALYGVETKRINEAVKNNPDKFPQNYMFELSDAEFKDLRSKFSTTKFAKTRAVPKAFTEKGLYMIATILRSKEAIDATFAIIETFSKIRALSRNVKELSVVKNKNDQQAIMQKSGELIAEILDDDLAVTDSETSIELNFAVLKFKHTSKEEKVMNRIHYTKPSITDLEVSYATDAARNGWGERCYEHISRFEDAFKDHLGVQYAIATSSCTGVLHMGMAALGIGSGDEVIMADRLFWK